jgi:hypothetical protein
MTDERAGTEPVFFRSAGLRMHAARHPGAGGRPVVVVPGITTPAGARWLTGAATFTCWICAAAACPSGPGAAGTGPLTTRLT